VNTVGLSLVTSNGTVLCTNATIVSYGVVECYTKVGVVAAGTQISVKLNSTTYGCANIDTTQC
jgi:hypothetical protein